MAIGRHTAPAAHSTELLSLSRTAMMAGQARNGIFGLSGLVAQRPSLADGGVHTASGFQKKAEAAAELKIDAENFPDEIDAYLFQRIAGRDYTPPLDNTFVYNPYLHGPYFPPSITKDPFRDFYIPESKDSAAGDIFSLPPLLYAYEALEPYIDRYTMYLHHDKHFDAYRKNLNAVLAADPELSHDLVDLQVLVCEFVGACA